MYIAKRQLLVGDGVRNIGEPIPEAEGWLRRESWERFGFIEWVEDTPKKAPKKAVVQRRQ